MLTKLPHATPHYNLAPADIHVPWTTVREALQLSARLRLPSHIGCVQATRDAFVQEVRVGAGPEPEGGEGRSSAERERRGGVRGSYCGVLHTCRPAPCANHHNC